MKYYVTHKCALCGAIADSWETKEITDDDLPIVLKHLVKWMGIYEGDAQRFHRCSDESFGVIVFAGLERRNEP